MTDNLMIIIAKEQTKFPLLILNVYSYAWLCSLTNKIFKFSLLFYALPMNVHFTDTDGEQQTND